MNKEQILAAIRSLQDEWKGIKAKAANEKRETMTPEESERGKTIAAELKNLRGQMETIEEMEKHEAWANESRNAPPDIPLATKEEERGEKPKIEVGKDRAASRPFSTFGEFLQAVYRTDSPRNSAHKADERLLLLDKEWRAATGLGESVPSDGGWLVQRDFATELFKNVFAQGQILPRVRRVPIGPNANGLIMNAVDETSRANGSRWGGVQGYWADEADTLTASKPKFRRMELGLKKLIGLCYATDELLADATALGSVMQQAFTEEFDFKINDAIVNGTGAGQPLGVLNAACLVSITKETGQAAATLLYENVNKAWARLMPSSYANAVWFINQDVLPQLNGMSLAIGTGGVPVYLPAGGLSATPYGQLFGRPVVPIEQCKTLGTVGDVILADFSRYLFIDKGGVESASSMHVRFINDEMCFRFTFRCNGQPLDTAAITPANGSNTVSPFVAIATRA